jgi:hypothetical protein
MPGISKIKLASFGYQCPNCHGSHPESFTTHICGVCTTAWQAKDPKVGKDGKPVPQPCPDDKCSSGSEQLWPAVSFHCAICDVTTTF